MALEFLSTDNLSPALTEEVSNFLDGQNTSHLFQFPQWAALGSRLVLSRQAGSLRWVGTFGVHPPLGRKVPWIRALVSNRGPVCDDRALWNSVIEELAEYMGKLHFAYVDVSPEWTESLDADPHDGVNKSSWECVGKPRTSLRLDLAKTEDQLFGNFRKNTRYEIRRAQRSQVAVSLASSADEISEFLLLYQRMAAQKGFSPESIDDLRRLIGWLVHTPSRGALLLARLENAPLGGAVIGRAGRRCWYIWGANQRNERLDVGHILQWEAVLWAKSHGCAEYDFGGYTPGATSGPAWFKAGFGGSVITFIPTHRRITEPKRHRVFRLLSRLVPP